MFVDADGRLVEWNGTAEDILDQRDGLCVVNGVLAADTEAGRKNLQRAVRAAVATTAICGPSAASRAVVPRPSGRRPLMVSVRRAAAGDVAGAPVMGGRAGPLAVVVTRDPERNGETSDCRFADLYNLTTAERRLAALILDGLPLRDAAARLGVTRNTARSHMKHIYAKTDTGRQVDLIQLHNRTCAIHG